MVRDFHITNNLTEIGYYSGFVTAAYFIGELLFSYLWGALSDRYGRRPIILMGSIGGTIAILMFGFSPSLWFAVICRFFYGASMAYIGVQKTYIVCRF